MSRTDKSYFGPAHRRSAGQAAAARRRAGRPEAQVTLADIAADQRRLEAQVLADEARACQEDAARAVTEREDRAARRKQWPLGEARNLVRDSYAVEQVMRMTGWPRRMLADVKPGVW